MKADPIRQLYRDGVRHVIALQRSRTKPFRREEARPAVERIIENVGLRGDPREQYFRLFAICALINKEPLYRFWRKP